MAQVTFLDAIKQAMQEEMERDPTVVLIGEDVGVYGGAFKTSEGLLAKFGWERVIDTPISESAIVGAACGMSYLGLRPIAEMQFIDYGLGLFQAAAFASFPRDAVVDLAAKHRLPAIYTVRQYVDAGGLVSYGVDAGQLFFRAATFVDKSSAVKNALASAK